MKYMNGSISLAVAFLAVTLFLLSFTLSANAQTLYSCVSPRAQIDPVLRILDPDTGATISTLDLTLDGVDIVGCNGLAKDPTTGTCYMMISTPNTGGATVPGARLLTILNPFTGQLKQVGNTGQRYAGIAFDSQGTLYGLTGDQNFSGNPINRTTLFTINKNTGESTIFLPLVVDEDGESLAFNPDDGLLYRLSRDPNYQSIDPVTKAVTTIPLSGFPVGEPFSLVYRSDNVFLLVRNGPQFMSITSDGVGTVLGNMENSTKGLAFDCVVPPTNVPTLSEWGLIAMAGILGVAGFMVIRRRKVAA